MTRTETVPDVQAGVWGSPVIAGEDEMTQLVAFVTVADRVTGPPLSGNVDDDGVNAVTVGAGWAATVTVVLAFVVLEPVAAKVNVYVLGLTVVSGGTVTGSDTVPEMQAWVSGSPVIAGALEITQLVAPVTVADRVTAPPLSGREDNDGANPVIVGAGTAAEDVPAPVEFR